MKWASYHNHTTFSDGAEQPCDFLPFAEAAGVAHLGFADHYYKATPDATIAPDWALQLDAVETYFETIAHVKAIAPASIEIVAGLEFDWLDNSGAWLAPIAADPRLDYTIGSVHFVGKDSIDLTRFYWERLSRDEINHVTRRYWQTLCDMVNSQLFDIAGHLDLVKKFNFYPTEDMSDVIADTLDAIADTHMTVELNTAGWRKDCRACYPTEAILRECFRRNIPVTLSSDAHQAHLVAADFDRGADILARVGYTHVAQFRKRERILVPLTR
jgi:histidinol-phosphatase (PHP family)